MVDSLATYLWAADSVNRDSEAVYEMIGRLRIVLLLPLPAHQLNVALQLLHVTVSRIPHTYVLSATSEVQRPFPQCPYFGRDLYSILCIYDYRVSSSISTTR